MPDKLRRGSETDEYGQPVPADEPSPTEIGAALERIRAGWTPRERRRRLVQPRQAWTVPVVKIDLAADDSSAAE